MFLTAILAFRDLPPGEHDYWREMIAADVFDEREDVLSHILLPLRGTLGAMTPAPRAAFRQQLASAAVKPPQ